LDHRKNGFKPPLFGSSSNTYQQGQLAQSGSKVTKSLGKKTRWPIKCWGCEGDHLYIDCPHNGDRVRTMHNIQEENTMEYVSGNLPRIYAILENRQANHQSNIIEIEG